MRCACTPGRSVPPGWTTYSSCTSRVSNCRATRACGHWRRYVTQHEGWTLLSCDISSSLWKEPSTTPTWSKQIVYGVCADSYAKLGTRCVANGVAEPCLSPVGPRVVNTRSSRAKSEDVAFTALVSVAPHRCCPKNRGCDLGGALKVNRTRVGGANRVDRCPRISQEIADEQGAAGGIATTREG
jgi:hypothetical protein